MSILLMCGDTPVYELNLDELVFKVHRADLLPFSLKDNILTEPPKGFAERVAVLKQVEHNSNALTAWLAGRTLLLSRDNAKWLFKALNIPQSEDPGNKAKLALLCKGISLSDNYWVVTSDGIVPWDTVNLRHIPLNEIVTQIALHGKGLAIQGTLDTPELTTNGTYAKAWRRHADGSLWLYKKGAKDATEARIEVMCSNLLDKMNVKHVHYEMSKDDGVDVCICPCMTDDKISMVSAMDYRSYCTRKGLTLDRCVLGMDSEGYYKMHIVDYLISNRDRHDQNWGFLFDADTTEILGCHPLFDHNNAFDLYWMNEPDVTYQVTERPLRESALYAMKRVDFHFTADITRKDFITDRQYKSFMRRAKELGVKTIPTPQSG